MKYSIIDKINFVVWYPVNWLIGKSLKFCDLEKRVFGVVRKTLRLEGEVSHLTAGMFVLESKTDKLLDYIKRQNIQGVENVWRLKGDKKSSYRVTYTTPDGKVNGEPLVVDVEVTASCISEASYNAFVESHRFIEKRIMEIIKIEKMY